MVGRSLLITSLTFAVLILVIDIVLLSLQLTNKGPSGPDGDQGVPGLPELVVPSKISNLNLTTSVIQFIVPGGFTVFQNTKFKTITCGFYLTGLVTQAFFGSEQISLFTLPSDFTPSFVTGAIGIISNVLNPNQNHVLLYDKSKTPNCSFLVRVSFTLQPSDRFLVSLFFCQ
jgi:hypothetical protein